MQLPVAENENKGFTDMQTTNDAIITVECPEQMGQPGLLHIAMTDLKSAFAPTETRVDIAVSKNGFSTGAFVTITPVAGTKALMPQVKDSLSVHQMKALGALQLAGEVKALANEGRADWTVGGLESGLNYYVRLSSLSNKTSWAAAKVVRVQGPTCPSDETNEKP
jgi:hypothetical protein